MSVQRKKTRTLRLRSQDEGGAALVEAAFIILPLCLFLFGIIEYGFIFKDSLTLSSASRAGARTASAEPRQGSFYPDTISAVERAAAAADFQQGDWVRIYRADPAGNPSDNCSSSCVEYQWNGSSFAQTGGGGWPEGSHVACLGPGADSVGVQIRQSHKAVSGFFGDITLTEKTVMRFEPMTENCS